MPRVVRRLPTALCLLMLLGLLGGAYPVRGVAQEPVQIRYFQLVDQETARNQYLRALIVASLEKEGIAAEIVPIRQPMSQDRALALTQSGDLDLVVTMTSAEREAAFAYVPVPLYRGLFGARALVVRADDARFDALEDPAELRSFTILQGHDWPDTEILRANGFEVVTVQGYEPLYQMLARGRADAFSGSVLEVQRVLEEYPELNLKIEPRFVLAYPAALYAYINPAHAALATHLERGLWKAIEDGTVEALFNQYLAERLRPMDLEGRTILHLDNPFHTPSEAYDRVRFFAPSR